MKSNFVKINLLLAGLLCSFCNVLLAQESEQEVKEIIIRQDSLFWQAYNTCNTASYPTFFSEDVEFYHDKGGITYGLPALMEVSKKNLCNEDKDFRLRREVVAGSVQVFPLKKNDVVYGVILSGEHVFYVLEKGKQDRLDGLAKFTHLWLLKDGAWKMTRVLSYAHGPATYKNNRKEITLQHAQLLTYAGKYKGPQSGILDLQPENGLLAMHIGDKTFLLYAEKENLFFSKERDLTFEFIKNNNTGDTKLLVRESGKVAEELVSIK